SDFILPANPFGELEESSLAAFVECTIYEESSPRAVSADDAAAVTGEIDLGESLDPPAPPPPGAATPAPPLARAAPPGVAVAPAPAPAPAPALEAAPVPARAPPRPDSSSVLSRLVPLRTAASIAAVVLVVG